MTSTPTATAAPPSFLSSIDVAAAIVVIATRVAKGLPFMMIRRCNVTGDVLVHVERADLPRWLIEFDIPAPEWDPTPSYDGESVHLAARWPEHAFCHLPIFFRIACSANEPAQVGA